MTKVGVGGVVLLPGQARQVNEGSFDVLELATREITDGSYSLIETIETGVGTGPPVHIHRDAAESFYVIAGAYSMHLDGRDFDCPAGSFVYVPRGMAHTFRVLKDGSRKLNLYTPSAMEGYFDELSAAVRTGADEAVLTEIASRYSMEIVGPVPRSYLANEGDEASTN